MKLRLGISEAITHWAKYEKNELCVINENLRLSFGELNSIVNYLAEQEFLKKTKSNYIPLFVENKFLTLCAIIGTLRSGKYPVILNPKLKPDEIRFALADINESYVYTESKLLKNIPSEFIPNELIEYSISDQKQYISDRVSESPSITDTWGILYSSGTTGNPKGITRSQFSILSELLGWCMELETRCNSSYYIGRPIHYTGGLVLTLSVLLIGGKVYIKDDFSPKLYFDQVEREGIDLSFLVPRQITQLIDYLKENNIDNPPYAKTILSMGAAFPAPLKLDAKQYLKSDIIESWGNTEGLGTITIPKDLEVRPTSIGRPFLCDDLFIVNEKFERVKPNTIGRLAGRVDSSFSEYNNRKELTEELVKGDMIVSEDLGLEDEDGYFYLYGRLSDLVHAPNCKLYPIILEKQIAMLDIIDEVAVFGIGKSPNEIPVCVVTLKTEITDENQLLTIINSALDGEQNLAQVKSIKEFPKTASGKIIKNNIKYLFNRG
jgi:o-succinylbenzoate---CoA ligase